MSTPPATVEACAVQFLLSLSTALGTFSTALGGVRANPPLLATLTTKEGLSLTVSDVTGKQLVAWNEVAGQPADVTVTIVPGRTLVINGQTVKT